jgi:hypothetical protein
MVRIDKQECDCERLKNIIMSKANIKKEMVGADSKNHKEVNEFTITGFLEELKKITQIEIDQEAPREIREGGMTEFLRDTEADQERMMEGKVNMYLLALLM